MKRLALVLFVLCTVSATAQYKVHIVAAEGCEYASSQLRHFLELGGGLTAGSDGAHIYVGNTAYLRRHYGAEVASLRDDGYLVCGDGTSLCLYGAGEKGTLYAVYAFLERLGYRLYTPDAMVVPDVSNLKLPKCCIVSNPAFSYREVAYYYPNQSQLYADWHRVHTQADRERLFGMYVHTFGKLLPPAIYFDRHPEWYSLNGGRRMRDGQLCLSNPAVLEELCQRLADTMARRPEAQIWSVSPNDNYNACECAYCRRLDSLYGGQSGTLLWFVNQVAARFPDKTISTLAYQYTRKAPSAGKLPAYQPAPNVQIMLCPIESGRQAPIPQTDPAFSKDMKDWARLVSDERGVMSEELSDERLVMSDGSAAVPGSSSLITHHSSLYIWDYVVQFRNFWNPFPNLHVLQPNLQFFKENGARMMFEQATGAQNVTSWMDIRCYMIAKLMWDPYIDIDSVMDDFFRGYYGEAGRYVKEIIDTMTVALIESGQTLNIYGYPVDAAEGYLSPEHRRQYWQLLTDAWNAITDSTVDSRFYYFYTSLLFAEVELAIHEGTVSNEELLSWLNRLTELLHKFNVPQMMEMGISPGEYRTAIIHYMEKRGADNKSQHKKVALRKAATAPYSVADLTDGEAGIMNYRNNWLGFWGDTLDATVSLDTTEDLSSISLDFYFYPLSWIFLPQRVAFYLSDDGVDWRQVYEEHPVNPEILATPDMHAFTFESDTPLNARYLRVVAEPLPEIPAWHRAAGQKPWIFTDEIIVK